jgi:hypothetical protein
MAHGKGVVVVQPSMAYGKGLGYDNAMRRCRGLILCRALVSVVTVLASFVVHFVVPFLCGALCHALHVCFVVRGLFVVRRSSPARQSHRYRVDGARHSIASRQ